MPQSLRQLATTVIALFVFAVTLPVQAGDTLDRVVDFKVLKVGMSADQPPLNTYNREGQLMGYDVDLARALATAMRARLEIKVLPFGELLEALAKDEVDAVISGMSITPQRSQTVSFVGPYMMSGKSLLTRNSVLAGVESASDFDRPDVKLVALKNSTSAEFARSTAPNAQLREIDHYDDGVKLVIDGEADAMIADLTICLLTVLRNPDAGLTTLPRPITVDPIGIAINRDDPEFYNLLDNYLEAYTRSGLLTKLREKWFESNDWVKALP